MYISQLIYYCRTCSYHNSSWAWAKVLSTLDEKDVRPSCVSDALWSWHLKHPLGWIKQSRGVSPGLGFCLINPSIQQQNLTFWLKSSFKRFYSHHHDLLDCYQITCNIYDDWHSCPVCYSLQTNRLDDITFNVWCQQEILISGLLFRVHTLAWLRRSINSVFVTYTLWYMLTKSPE